jgi:hypothetical protein
MDGIADEEAIKEWDNLVEKLKMQTLSKKLVIKIDSMLKTLPVCLSSQDYVRAINDHVTNQ